MNKKQQIICLYYEKGLIQTEIAQKLSVSKAYITKIIKTDSRYASEKEKRKKSNKEKNKLETKMYIKRKKEATKLLDDCIKKQHIQASNELSSRRIISNRSFRDWNKSIYEYNSKSKAYILKKDIIATNDIPKRISWK